MKNSTKVRLHLSKKLFESLTREIIKEAKANDGYTVAVKRPKAPKVNELFGLGAPKAKYKVGQQVKVKGAKGDTEGAETLMNITKILSTDKDMGSKYQGAGRGDLNQAKYEFTDDQVISEMEKMEEKMSSKEKMAKGLYNEVDAEMDTNKMKRMEGNVPTSTSTTSVQDMNMGNDGKPAIPGLKEKMNSEFEKEILKVLKAKFDLDPTTATIDFGPNGMSIKPVNYQVWADKFTKGNQGRNGNYVDDKAQKIAAYFNKKYGKNLVAEDEGALQPGDNITWLDGHQKENKGVVQSQEGGDYYKVKVTAAPIGGGAKVGDIITKQSGDVKKAMGEMQTNTNELFGLGAKGVFKPGQRVKYKGQGGWMVDKFLGKKDELEKYSIRDASGSGKYLEVIGNEITVDENSQMNEFAEEGTQLITALATLLGVGVPLATSIYKDLKNAKTPEAKKQVMQSLGTSVGGAAGAHLQKPQTTPSLNELRKQIKK